MIRKLLKKLPYVLWILPGFLLWASFPPMGERFDSFFALAPILWYARRHDARKSFRTWFANGFFFWFATLSWMPAIIKNGGPWYLVVLGWGVLSAYCALYFGLFGWFSSRVWGWVRGRSYGWRLFAIVVAEPVLWSGLELVRSRFLGGFAWNQLGVPAVNAGLGSPASLGGVYLVSALVILVNGTFASIAERMLEPFEGRLAALFGRKGPSVDLSGEKAEAAFAAPATPPLSFPKWVRSVETLLPFLLILGVHRLAKPAAPQEGGTVPVRFGLMQRDFPPPFKPAEDWRPAYGAMIGELVQQRPDVLVLPESALCEMAPDVISAHANAFVGSWLGLCAPSAVVAGGSRRDAVGRMYNSAAAYTLWNGTNVVSSQVYDKVHLVPFGEFIPGDKLVPALQQLAPVGSCTPGELKLLGVNVRGVPVRVAPAICYEDTDSAQIRRQAEMGAQVLVFMTNDSWFSESVETEQHAWQAVARAIETGLPVVRVGNSGVSGTVSPAGKARWLSDEAGKPLVDRRGTACVSVDLEENPRRTAYVRLGDWPLGLAFLLLITAMGVIKYKHDYEKRRKVSL